MAGKRCRLERAWRTMRATGKAMRLAGALTESCGSPKDDAQPMLEKAACQRRCDQRHDDEVDAQHAEPVRFRQVGDRLLKEQRQIQSALIAVDSQQLQRLPDMRDDIGDQTDQTGPSQIVDDLQIAVVGRPGIEAGHAPHELDRSPFPVTGPAVQYAP